MASPRILIIRTSALGDIVQALPVLSELRARYPAAHIGWVVERTFAPLLREHPDIDELLTVQFRTWRRQLLARATWRQIGGVVNALHEFSADVVLDLMSNHKAGLIAAASMCDRRLGLAHADRREPSSSLWISEPSPARGVHAVERMLSVLAGLGIQPGAPDLGGSRLRGAGATPLSIPEGPFVLLHPLTGWKNKDYPPQAWGHVAGRIAAHGVPVLVAPGPGEEAVAATIANGGTAGVRAIEPTPFPDLVALQRHAALVLGGDTGPVHLAHALGTPVVCVMGPTDPRKHGPYGAIDQTIWMTLPCSFCHKRFDSAKACLQQIDPDLVADRALAILDSKLH